MIEGTVETSASFEARYAPLSYPTAGAISDGRPFRDSWDAFSSILKSGCGRGVLCASCVPDWRECSPSEKRLSD
jgi:hypothetical protein